MLVVLYGDLSLPVMISAKCCKYTQCRTECRPIPYQYWPEPQALRSHRNLRGHSRSELQSK